MKSLPCVMMFGTQFMEALPENLRNHIVEAGKMIIEDYEKQYITQSIERSVAAILEKCEEVIPSEELLAQMKEATKPIHEYFKSVDEDCAKMYEKMAELIAQDDAAGGEALPY
jgi:TRAP-type C4-dicarboxylate transport system substrate-binding protein